MKFAEHLSAHITPEWRKQYINYEVGKLARIFGRHRASDSLCSAGGKSTSFGKMFDVSNVTRTHEALTQECGGIPVRMCAG